MHPYISYLLDDIAAAHRTEMPEEEAEQTIEVHFEAFMGIILVKIIAYKKL